MVERLTYTVAETAKVLGISRPLAYKLVKEREGFPVIKLGKRMFIPRKGLEDWLLTESAAEALRS